MMVITKKRCSFFSSATAISFVASFLLFFAFAQPSGASRFGVFEGVPSMREKVFIADKLKNRPSWKIVPRGGEIEPELFTSVVTDDVATNGVLLIAASALKGLASYMKGPKADTMLLLLTTALNTPLSKMVGASPILGYLLLGLLFGPNGFGLVNDIHTTELMADMGIVFFLFEMGIHLDFKTLMSMRRDVFGLGGSQFILTAAVVATICKFGFGLSTAAQIVLGGGLALSSSAFVLQLLKDKDQMNTTFGRSSFGVLLLQDLAVVPLLVVTPILAGGGGDLIDALGSAGLKATIALSIIAFVGKFLLNPFFDTVAKTNSQEAFVGAILSTVLGLSFLTEGLGLSNTLGAFLAGILLSETQHRHRIEAEIAPFRGILVGLFFFTVGFEIDLQLIGSKPGLIAAVVLGIAALKAAIASSLGLLFGLPKGTALRLGLILSQGGEFAFVAFRLARSCGIFSDELTKMMLTCVSLTMCITPLLDDIGAKLAIDLDAVPSDNKNEKSGRKKRN